MKIEDEIQKVSFKSPQQKAVINILYTGGWITNLQNNFLKQFDITHQQFNILNILNNHNPESVSVTDIKSRMIDRMSNVSRLVEKLRQKGLVERIHSETDRRMVEVHLTEQGLQLLGQLHRKLFGIRRHFQNLSDEEALLLSDLLDKLRNT